MASFIAMYTKPEDAEGFLAEYKADHLPICEKFPNTPRQSLTVLKSTPRRTEPAYFLLFEAEWASEAEMFEAMKDPSLMEASGHAIGLLKKYGNAAEMMLGDSA